MLSMPRPQVEDILHYAEENRANILTEVTATAIPAELQEYLDRYQAAGWKRPHFLWQWAWRLLNTSDPGFTLSCVPDAAHRRAALVKFVYLLAVTVTDDAADERQDEALVDHLCAAQRGWSCNIDLHEKHAASVALVRDLFSYADRMLDAEATADLPRAMLRFDLTQVWNAFTHASFVNTHPQASTSQEALTYGGHNMMMIVFADIDLCFSPGFTERETPHMRDVFSAAQDMARVGNWVTTWRREIPVGDLKSGVAAYLLNHTDLTVETLQEAIAADKLEPVYQLVEVSQAEQTLLDLWSRRRDDLCALAPKISSFDVGVYIEGLESVMMHHFASIGVK